MSKKKSNDSLKIHTSTFFLPTKGMHWVEAYFVYKFHPSNFQFSFPDSLLTNSHPFLILFSPFINTLNHPWGNQSLEEPSSEQSVCFSVNGAVCGAVKIQPAHDAYFQYEWILYKILVPLVGAWELLTGWTTGRPSPCWPAVRVESGPTDQADSQSSQCHV